MSVQLRVVLYMAAIEIAGRDNAEWAGIVFDLIRNLSEFASAGDYAGFLAELTELLSRMEV